MPLFKLEEMTWVEFRDLNKDRTLMLLPLSPLEEHGPHLPLGTDLFGAHEIARGAARLLAEMEPGYNIILAPPLPAGCTGTAADLPGGIALRGTTLAALVQDVCASYARHGLKHLLITNHHLDPTHMKAILSGLAEVNSQYGVTYAELMSRTEYAGIKTTINQRLKDMGLDPRTEIHADVKETSFIKFRHPALCREVYKTLPPVNLDIREAMRKGARTFLDMGADMGYVGSPARAQASLGQSYLEQWHGLAAGLGLKLLKGEPLPEIPLAILKMLEERIKLD